MPSKVAKIPGSWAAGLDWDTLTDGNTYLISEQEMAEANVKLETVRVTAHTQAKQRGLKFRTKTVKGDGLYLQAYEVPPQKQKTK